eukprot:TRINITY_DN4866_c0_g2_i5.p1 TRINITY_DN4866_c0_g2~~TRINITY_DN4866_c0_g2_i5.p1  ORF type:complete len:172 (-),score=35.07 TRINITY_DN4866_c0_g2_i5:315-830(-)
MGNSTSLYPLPTSPSFDEISDAVSTYAKESKKDVRVLENNEVNRELILEVICDAFSHDPMFRSLVLDDSVSDEVVTERQQIMTRWMMHWSMLQCLNKGMVMGAFDGDELVGCAMVIKPGEKSEDFISSIKTVMKIGAPPYKDDWVNCEKRFMRMEMLPKMRELTMKGNDFW